MDDGTLFKLVSNDLQSINNYLDIKFNDINIDENFFLNKIIIKIISKTNYEQKIFIMPTLVIKGIITKGLNIGLKYTTKPKNLGIQNME